MLVVLVVVVILEVLVVFAVIFGDTHRSGLNSYFGFVFCCGGLLLVVLLLWFGVVIGGGVSGRRGRGRCWWLWCWCCGRFCLPLILQMGYLRSEITPRIPRVRTCTDSRSYYRGVQVP